MYDDIEIIEFNGKTYILDECFRIEPIDTGYGIMHVIVATQKGSPDKSCILGGYENFKSAYIAAFKIKQILKDSSS